MKSDADLIQRLHSMYEWAYVFNFCAMITNLINIDNWFNIISNPYDFSVEAVCQGTSLLTYIAVYIVMT